MMLSEAKKKKKKKDQFVMWKILYWYNEKCFYIASSFILDILTCEIFLSQHVKDFYIEKTTDVW